MNWTCWLWLLWFTILWPELSQSVILVAGVVIFDIFHNFQLLFGEIVLVLAIDQWAHSAMVLLVSFIAHWTRRDRNVFVFVNKFQRNFILVDDWRSFRRSEAALIIELPFLSSEFVFWPPNVFANFRWALLWLLDWLLPLLSRFFNSYPIVRLIFHFNEIGNFTTSWFLVFLYWRSVKHLTLC